MPAMKLFLLRGALLIAATAVPLFAQTSVPSGSDNAGEQLQVLSKKIDEQNLKLDALSQQLLKLEQQIATQRPGVIIGEATPTPAPSSATTAASPAAATAAGNAHVVTKGETLTSIAKANKVGVQDLQKFNHIENDRALQIGQTIMIPSPGGSPAASGSPSPNE